jgi:hypothetical protein
MHEWKEDSRSTKQPDLEERLAAFYGPQLRDQPLSSASWEQLRSQLGPQRPPRRQRMLRLRSFWRRSDHSDPAYIRETFSRVMHEARVSYPPSLLQCSFKANVQVPSLCISAFGWHKIKLVLPLATEKLLSQPELDVLVATSLARYRYIRKPRHVIVHILIAIALLLALVAVIVFSKHNFLIVILPIAITLCILWLLHTRGRRLAFHADAVVVQWLGRERTCRGLHALANRSRSPRRSRWGEPSLAERIERVCGTQVTIEEDRLMLVR